MGPMAAAANPSNAHQISSPDTEGCKTRQTPTNPTAIASAKSHGAFSRRMRAPPTTVSAMKRGAV